MVFRDAQHSHLFLLFGKWDNFYEKIPISLLHHTNGNAICKFPCYDAAVVQIGQPFYYLVQLLLDNTSHPLLERLVGQLEVEALYA